MRGRARAARAGRRAADRPAGKERVPHRPTAADARDGASVEPVPRAAPLPAVLPTVRACVPAKTVLIRPCWRQLCARQWRGDPTVNPKDYSVPQTGRYDEYRPALRLL